MKRRDFLRNSLNLAYSSATFYSMQSFLELCFKANLAQASTIGTGINYVQINIDGAPPKWLFDQPLNPHNTNKFVAGGFGNAIEKTGNNFNTVIADQKVSFGGQELYLPPVWSMKSAKLGSDFKDLLNHSIMIRGIDMEIDGHITNRERLVRPIASQPSLMGLAADKATTPFPAMGENGMITTKAFKSSQGTGIVAFEQDSPIDAVKLPFDGPVTKAAELDSSVQQSIEVFDQYARNLATSSGSAPDQQMAAYEMFSRNLGTYYTEWNALYVKYKEIVDAELRADFPAVMASDPKGDGSSIYKIDTNNLNDKLSDYVDSNTHANHLAYTFSFAEFALSKGITSNLTLNATRGGQLLGNFGSTNINFTADQHQVGKMPSTYYSSLYYRCLLGCLIEFTNQLKAYNLFNNTLIHLSSEFSRTPKIDGSGSDHGFNGSSTTLISGMIATPGLIGNISQQPHKANTSKYDGTFGEAADVTGLGSGSRPIVNDDICDSVSEILGIEKVSAKGQSLVTNSSGKITFAKNWENKNV